MKSRRISIIRRSLVAQRCPCALSVVQVSLKLDSTEKGSLIAVGLLRRLDSLRHMAISSRLLDIVLVTSPEE